MGPCPVWLMEDDRGCKQALAKEDHEERLGMLSTANSAEEAMPPFWEIQQGGQPADNCSTLGIETYCSRKDAHSEGAISDGLHHPRSKAQHGLPGFQGLKVLRWPRSLQGTKPNARWWHHLLEFEHGRTSPRKQWGVEGPLGPALPDEPSWRTRTKSFLLESFKCVRRGLFDTSTVLHCSPL